jgi:non-specific serine/threonine protein kinase/serine/threonine-protein kinase
MNPERWKQVKLLLDEGIALEPADRCSFLDRSCAGDSELRREVESLLSSNERAGTGFLNTPAVDLGEGSAPTATRVGRRIGAYDILEEIGHGGMGEVYRAGRADGQYEKEVAIKLVRGGYDTASVLERFRHERQILASLDHPNIARLLDGGTAEDGIPYLVMELIQGTAIDQYCDAQKLTVSERLRLFLQVCSAVQYAHQRLVIHRDIKPGNILVTRQGEPKLLDFGIAKILDPAINSAATIAGPMTPEYASPEQILGEPITTATDVYSLGVVLFQLLTGRSPYPTNTHLPHEFARAICELEPEQPSTVVARGDVSSRAISSSASEIPRGPELPKGPQGSSPAKLRRRLSGDLDTITLRALRKEPQRRYASVEKFAEDIQRHLEGLPITALRDSWRYRARKFTVRHKLGVTATALVLMAVLGGVAATVREARIAAANERRAEQRFNDVRKLANSLMFEIHDAIEDLPGSTAARRLLVTRALEYLDSLSAQSKGDSSLQKELAAAYQRVGDVLGYPYAANLGDQLGALQSYRKALAIRESLAVVVPNDAELERALVGTYFRIADVMESEGNFAEALTALGNAQGIAQRMAVGSTDPELVDNFAGSYYFTAGIQVQTGDFAAALENYKRSAAIREAALQANPASSLLRTHLAADYAGLAKCLELKNDLPQAIETQSKAAAILEEVSKSNPQRASLTEYLGEALNRLATYRKEHGDLGAALETYRRAHQIFGDLLAADAKNSLARSNFGFSDNGIAESLVLLGKPAAAARVFRESVAIFEEMSPRTASNRYLRSGLADAYSGLGGAYSILATAGNITANQKREHWEEARSSCQKSLALWNDKEKRGELESAEHESAPRVAHCLATSEEHLHNLTLPRNGPH